MPIFMAIAIAGFIVMACGFIFGHDHDVDHDVGHDIGHDVGGIVSIFSTRVLFTFIMGFGAAGAIARYYNASYPVASIIGVANGVVLGALMYLVVLAFIKQQASSVIPMNSLVGCMGSITVPIDENGTGEIGISFREEYHTFPARASNAGAIAKGHRAKVISITGSVLTVEEIK